MIKINLLPFRVARKKENIRRQISVFLLMVIFSLLALFWYTQHINKQIASVKDKTRQVDIQITKYKEKADRVEKIKNDLKVLDDKLIIVADLEKQREKQLILFDRLTDLIVPERMWLESLKTDQNSVTISGIAYDNPTIADFMEKLEKSSLFFKVDLKTAKMKKFKNGAILKSFELLCTKEKPVEVENKDPKQGKKDGRRKK